MVRAYFIHLRSRGDQGNLPAKATSAAVLLLLAARRACSPCYSWQAGGQDTSCCRCHPVTQGWAMPAKCF